MFSKIIFGIFIIAIILFIVIPYRQERIHAVVISHESKKDSHKWKSAKDGAQEASDNYGIQTSFYFPEHYTEQARFHDQQILSSLGKASGLFGHRLVRDVNWLDLSQEQIDNILENYNQNISDVIKSVAYNDQTFFFEGSGFTFNPNIKWYSYFKYVDNTGAIVSNTLNFVVRSWYQMGAKGEEGWTQLYLGFDEYNYMTYVLPVFRAQQFVGILSVDIRVLKYSNVQEIIEQEVLPKSRNVDILVTTINDDQTYELVHQVQQSKHIPIVVYGTGKKYAKQLGVVYLGIGTFETGKAVGEKMAKMIFPFNVSPSEKRVSKDPRYQQMVNELEHEQHQRMSTSEIDNKRLQESKKDREDKGGVFLVFSYNPGERFTTDYIQGLKDGIHGSVPYSNIVEITDVTDDKSLIDQEMAIAKYIYNYSYISGVTITDAALFEPVMNVIYQANKSHATKIPFVTMNPDQTALREIAKGNVLFAVDFQNYLMGYLAMTFGYMIYRGQTLSVTPQLFTGPKMITQDNLESMSQLLNQRVKDPFIFSRHV